MTPGVRAQPPAIKGTDGGPRSGQKVGIRPAMGGGIRGKREDRPKGRTLGTGGKKTYGPNGSTEIGIRGRARNGPGLMTDGGCRAATRVWTAATPMNSLVPNNSTMMQTRTTLPAKLWMKTTISLCSLMTTTRMQECLKTHMLCPRTRMRMLVGTMRQMSTRSQRTGVGTRIPRTLIGLSGVVRLDIPMPGTAVPVTAMPKLAMQHPQELHHRARRSAKTSCRWTRWTPSRAARLSCSPRTL
mmetsp:Transcript_75647/g.125929  ORF Transcript_75647/g.125929 Transcript_75647/m.125929 type:complete len:242 (+) Transcript_75647:368-1093(+)